MCAMRGERRSRRAVLREPAAPALSAVRRVAVPRPAPNPDGRGSTVVPDRDEDHLDGIVLMTDRGLEHDRNEDAAAAGTVAGAAGQRPHAIVAAVCDGVSTSPDAYKASRAASTAGVEAMLKALAASRDMSSVVLAGLDDAAKAAAAAKTQGADDRAAPACTYAAAAVVFTSAGEAQITVANVGDSRAYWLPEPPAPATTPDRRRFPRAGTDLRGRTARRACRTEGCAHPDPVARWQRRIETVGRRRV